MTNIDKEVQYTKVPNRDNEKSSEIKEEVHVRYGYGIRHIQLVIFFLCLSISFIARGHLGVTIVAMTSQHNVQYTISNVKDNISLSSQVHESNKELNENVTIRTDAEEKWTVYRIYDWSKPIQEMVLTAFFLGYCLMNFPVSLACQRWGGKLPLEMSMYINGVVSILTPWLTLWGGWKAACACRVIQGLSQAGTFPGIQTLLAQWVPESERATMSSYVYAGSTAGTVIAFQLAGLLSAYFGWPATFWVIGVICIVTGACLSIFAEASPLEHKKISEEEKLYIIGNSEKNTVKRRAPCLAILTSKPVWGSFATHVGSGLCFVFIFTQVPTYIHYILGIDVKSSGLLSSLPYLFSFMTSLFFGVISDFFTNRNIVTVKNARRISNTISQVGMAVSLVSTSFASSTGAAVTCLVLAMCLQMGVHTGWMVNHIDLSPNYSGTLMGIGSTLMNVFILTLPVLVSNIVIDVKNPYQWRIMLYLIASIGVTTNMVFVFLMSADVQPWNEDPKEIDDLNLESIDKKEKETKTKGISTS